MALEHYCDGCNSGSDDESDHDEWCCGGDGRCPAVEEEPDCPHPEGHKWTRQGVGGSDSNPGVESLGGTAWEFRRRCRLCGIVEIIVEYGSQRDVGECDERRYERGAPDPVSDDEDEAAS